MFEFTKNIADNIVSQIGKTKNDMLQEVEEYEKVAKEKEKKAIENEAKAIENETRASDIDLEPQKIVEETEYNSETNTDEKIGETYELDVNQAAINKALYDDLLSEARKLRKEATDLRKDIVNLVRLAANLKLLAGDLDGALKDLKLAIEISVKAVAQTTNLLNDGISILRSTMFSFDLPNIEDMGKWIGDMGGNILKIVNFDDFNTKIQEGLDWLYEIGKKTGAKMAEDFISGIGGILDGVIKPFITGTNPLKNIVVFGLGLLGIYTEPQIDPAYIVKDERIDKAKKEAINLYIEYLNTLNISEEQKEKYRQIFEEKIQNIVVLKNEYFESIPGVGANTMGMYIGKSGGKGTGYLKEDSLKGEDFLNIVIHEVGGHGVGTVGQWKITQNGGIYIYDITDVNKIPLNARMNLNIAIDEAITEYFTRKICKKESANCSYNYSVELLEKMLNSMTKYGICDGDTLIYETYVGNDKKLLEKKINEVFGDNCSVEYMSETRKLDYSTIEKIMEGANGGNSEYNGFDLKGMDKVAEEFDRKCAEYAEKNKN